MTELLIFAGINFIFLIVGYLMGKGTLQEKVKEIIKIRNKVSTGGISDKLEQLGQYSVYFPSIITPLIRPASLLQLLHFIETYPLFHGYVSYLTLEG